MKKILFILSLFITSFSFGQLENANWCFGINGGVHFNTPPTTPTTFVSQINGSNNIGAMFSGASVSNAIGQLQFYTDGISVWDGNHQPLSNGTGLYGFSEMQRTTQNVIIVPKPGHPGIYYIFTIGTIANSWTSTSNPVGRGGIHYSVVDMNTGAGQVTLKNVSIHNHEPNGGVPIDYVFDYNATNTNPVFITTRTQMTSTLNATGDKVWLTIIADFHFNNQNTRMYYSFLIGENGINGIGDGNNPQPLVSMALNPANYSIGAGGIGIMKISPNRNLLCDAGNFQVNLYSFSKANGTISFIRNVYTEPGWSAVGYGMDFSPGSNYIYFSRNPGGIIQGSTPEPSPSNNSPRLYQYNIANNELSIVYQYNSAPSTGSEIPLVGSYGIQLGMDGNVYVCAYGDLQQYWHYLGVINEPDLPVPNCLFDPLGLELAPPNTRHNGSLPQWVHVETIWPKVYEDINSGTPNISALGKIICGNPATGNLYTFMNANMSNNVNHSGALPSTPGAYLVNYSTSSGITNWLFQNEMVGFILNNGNLQTILPNYTFPISFVTLFRDGVTGAIVSGPSLVPASEVILAEDNGTYITTTGNDLRVRSSSGTSIIPFLPGGYIFPYQNKYDPITKKLFVKYSKVSNGVTSPDAIVVYDLANNTLTNIHTFIPPTHFSSNMIQVNKSDQVFLNSNGAIYKYNYTTNDYTLYSPIGINNNGAIWGVDGTYSYVTDELMAFNSDDNFLYFINTGNNILKKIPYTVAGTCTSCMWISYYKNYTNDDVYLFGSIEGGYTATIGSQIYTLPGSNVVPVFLAKFNIQTDFSLRPPEENNFISTAEPVKTISSSVLQNKTNEKVAASSIEATLSPNPAKNSLLINLNQNATKKTSSFLVSITNGLGITMFSQTTNKETVNVNVSNFKPGIYYVTISTDKGDKTSQVFVKE